MLCTARFPLEQFKEAFKTLMHREAVGKVMGLPWACFFVPFPNMHKWCWLFMLQSFL